MKNRRPKIPALGVNIDHVATLRQARRGRIPDAVSAAREAVRAGADQITIHVREDRRHMQDRDIPDIMRAIRRPLNLEMALHPEIEKLALRHKPEKVCIVPEKREELTTEGGLDVVGAEKRLQRLIPELRRRKIQVSLFIDPIPKQIRMAASLGADAVEIHTGRYAETSGSRRRRELKRIRKAANLGHRLGLKVHAGHGLDCANVGPIVCIPEIEELNIGYSIICRAVFIGLRSAVREMKDCINKSHKSQVTSHKSKN